MRVVNRSLHRYKCLLVYMNIQNRIEVQSRILVESIVFLKVWMACHSADSRLTLGVT